MDIVKGLSLGSSRFKQFHKTLLQRPRMTGRWVVEVLIQQKKKIVMFKAMFGRGKKRSL